MKLQPTSQPVFFPQSFAFCSFHRPGTASAQNAGAANANRKSSVRSHWFSEPLLLPVLERNRAMIFPREGVMVVWLLLGRTALINVFIKFLKFLTFI
jgi:hypothetical protein